MSDNVVWAKFEKAVSDVKRDPVAGPVKPPHDHGGHGGGGGMSEHDMAERIGRLEGAVDGLKHGQNMTLAGVVGVGAVLLAVSLYTLSQVDALEDDVGALPGRIAAEVRESNRAFSDALSAAIAATRAPVVVMPASPPQPDKAATPE